MRKDEVIAKVQAHADEIRGRGATALYLFGSTVRGDARSESDVDFFMEYDPKGRFSLFDLAGLQNYLSDVLGANVDLGTKDGLHPVLREDILREAVRIL